MNEPLLTSLASLFSLAGIWVLWFFLFRAYFRDAFRQDLYRMRDGADSCGRVRRDETGAPTRPSPRHAPVHLRIPIKPT